MGINPYLMETLLCLITQPFPGVLFVAGLVGDPRIPPQQTLLCGYRHLPLSESEGVPDYLTADHSLHGVNTSRSWPLRPRRCLLFPDGTPAVVTSGAAGMGRV